MTALVETRRIDRLRVRGVHEIGDERRHASDGDLSVTLVFADAIARSAYPGGVIGSAVPDRSSTGTSTDSGVRRSGSSGPDGQTAQMSCSASTIIVPM